MKKKTYVIGYQGKGPTLEEGRAKLDAEGILVVAENPRYLVVELRRGGLVSLQALLPDWSIEASQGAKVASESKSPDTHTLRYKASEDLATQLFAANLEGLSGCGAGMSSIIVYFNSKKALKQAASEVPETFGGFPVESMVCKGTLRPCC